MSRNVFKEQPKPTKDKYRAWIVYGKGETPYKGGKVLDWWELSSARDAYGKDLRWEVVNDAEAAQDPH